RAAHRPRIDRRAAVVCRLCANTDSRTRLEAVLSERASEPSWKRSPGGIDTLRDAAIAERRRSRNRRRRGWIVSRERLSAIEEKLRQIHGVVAARIRVREDEAWEVHALVTEDTDSVRAQIRSALFAGFGVELDLDRINLVEVAREGE